MEILNQNNTHAITRADRAALLLDADAYFRAVRQSMLQAREQICILAWDINSAVEMIREEPDDGAPSQLADFLWHVLDQNPDLHIYILLWDYSMIYVAEREWNPFSRFRRKSHPRLHFKTDDQLPMGSSHHQKVVTVDDKVAYVGGLDFSIWRWDTTEHKFDHEGRRDPRDKPYGPYHDTQMLVDGPAARELGDLCRSRWNAAIGESLKTPDDSHGDRWPEGLDPDMEDVDLGISQTRALFNERSELFQVEQLTLDSIAAARDSLYMENQYLSSHRIMEALVERLREEDGPEIVIILTPDTHGWMEESTMGLLRERILEVLHEADEHGRLGVYAAWVSQGDERKQMYIHAKVHIVDDRLIKVGSSNLTNRSMRLDTECDLAFEYEEASTEIRRMRARLLAAFYQMDPKEVEAGVENAGGVLAWIESQSPKEGHYLDKIEYGLKSDWERRLADTRLLDPEEPPDPVHWVQRNLPGAFRAKLFKRGLWLISLLIVCLGAFYFLGTFWEDVFDGDLALFTWLETYRNTFQGVLLLLAVFIVGSSVGVPLNLLLVLSTLSFGSWLTLLCGLSGAFLGAQVGFGIGHWGGKPIMNRFSNDLLLRMNSYLRQSGLMPVVVLRLLPVAPFPVINIVAGSTHLQWRNYSLGTLLGMLPGMCAVVFLTDQTRRTLSEPSLGQGLILVAMVGVLIGLIMLLRKIWPKGQPED